MSVRLSCPLCGGTVLDGEPPVPSACPSCGSVVVGGAETPAGAAAAALEHAGLAGDPDTLARRLFEIEPDAPLSRRVAITSDSRQGFYRWWVVMGADSAESGQFGTLLTQVLTDG